MPRRLGKRHSRRTRRSARLHDRGPDALYTKRRSRNGVGNHRSVLKYGTSIPTNHFLRIRPGVGDRKKLTNYLMETTHVGDRSITTSDCRAHPFFERCQNPHRARGIQSAVRAAADTTPHVVAAESRALVLRARELDRATVLTPPAPHTTRQARSCRSSPTGSTLRAAGVTGDSGARARYYAKLRTDVARDRVRWTDAIARERTRDLRERYALTMRWARARCLEAAHHSSG